MVFGDDLKGELFNKIGASSGDNTFEMFKQAKQEQKDGNHGKAKELYEQIITLTITSTERLLSQKQHRSAAEQFFIQSKAYEMQDKTQERDLVLDKVVESLLAASKTAMDFGENNRGITAYTLAGIVCLTKGDEDRAFQIYTEGQEIADTKENSDLLKKILFSLGYLLDALRNINMAALTDAQNYIATDLRPMLSTSKMTGFEELLDSIIGFASKILETRIKLPKISITSTYPRDLLFNTSYDIVIEIENLGEGDAKNVLYEIVIPEDLELLQGEVKETIDTIGPQSKIERTFTVRMMTGDSYEENREITGSLTFIDMLNNTRRQILSPIDLEFRSVSKSSEFTEKIEKMMSDYLEVVAEGTQLPSELTNVISNHNEAMKGKLMSSIQQERFDNTEFGMELLGLTLDIAKLILGTKINESDVVSGFTSKLDDRANEVTLTLNAEKDNDLANQKQAHEAELSKLRDELNTDKQSELDKQKEWFDKETQRIIDENNQTINEIHEKNIADTEDALRIKEMDLSKNYEGQLDELRKEHNEALQKINKSADNKIKQHLADLEGKLKESHTREIQKKNDEVESAIRSMQEEHLKELDESQNRLRTELNDRHNKEVTELKDQLTEQETQLSERAIDDKESALKTLEAKLNHENETQRDEFERNFAMQWENKIEDAVIETKLEVKQELNAKDEEITKLQERVNMLEDAR